MPEPIFSSRLSSAFRLTALLCVVICIPSRARAVGTIEEKGPDGKVKFRYQTNVDDQRHGTYEELFPTGKPRVTGTYSNGLKSGTWVTRDAEGRTIETAGYRADKLEGAYARYFPGTTRLMLKAVYHAGDFNGPVTSLSQNGRILRQIAYPGPRAAVEKAWAELAVPSPKPVTYQEKPSDGPPYKAGLLASEAVEEALRVTKLYRALSGLPYQNLSVDPTLSDLAQHAAVCLVQVGSLTHTPTKPANMDDAFFKLAYQGCSQSNLHSSSDDDTLVGAVHGFMDDSDPSNIARVGHRTWILQPGLQRVGFGKAHQFAAMHVFDGMRRGPDYHHFAFPGEGYYPRQFIKPGYAWSLHLNTAKLKAAGGAVKVKVTRLDEYFQPVSDVATDSLSVADASNGAMNVVIFRPKLEKAEGRFWVQVEGLQTSRNQPALPMGYIVDLIEPAPAAKKPNDAAAAGDQ